MTDDGRADEVPGRREISMAARATIQLFGDDAVSKTAERLAEVEAEGWAPSVRYWRALLVEVERLRRRRDQF